MSRAASQIRGFTLIELLMAVAVLAVLATLAAPSYGKLIARTHTQTARSALDTTLNQARLSAVTRGAHVVVCPSDDGERCSRTTQWQHGWLAFADHNRDGMRSADEPLLGVVQAQPAGTAIVGTAGRLRVAYRPDGSATGTNQTLTICDRTAGADHATALIINQAGRVRSAAAQANAAAACLQVAG